MITIYIAGVGLTVEPLNDDPFDWRILVGGCAILHSIEALYETIGGAL